MGTSFVARKPWTGISKHSNTRRMFVRRRNKMGLDGFADQPKSLLSFGIVTDLKLLLSLLIWREQVWLMLFVSALLFWNLWLFSAWRRPPPKGPSGSLFCLDISFLSHLISSDREGPLLCPLFYFYNNALNVNLGGGDLFLGKLSWHWLFRPFYFPWSTKYTKQVRWPTPFSRGEGWISDLSFQDLSFRERITSVIWYVPPSPQTVTTIPE